MILRAPAREPLLVTPPPSPRPRRLDPLRFLGRAWRELRKMRTAIILLALLATLATVGTLLPQIPQNPRGVMGYVLNHPYTAPWFARLGLFDVFSSWPFLIVAGLMYVSIGASMFVRVPAAWRRGRFAHNRTSSFWAEVASIVFHASFFLLLVGVVWGKAAGFVGNVAVVEGQTFVEARAGYDNLTEGVLTGRHAGFGISVDRFAATYWPTGAPRDFVSHVRIIEGGRVVATRDIRVNHYVEYHGVKIYQAGYGWAPTLRLETADGRVVADSPTIFVGDPQFANGVIKAPSAGPGSRQLAATAIFIPDPQLTGDAIAPGTTELKNPLLLVRLYRGDLHLDQGQAQNVFSLDTSNLDLRWRGALRLHDTITTPDGDRLTFTGLRQYSDLTLNKDPGVTIVLAAFLIGLAALILSLYLPALGGEDRLAPHRTLAGD